MIGAFDLARRFDQYIEENGSNPKLWRNALRESLARLNENRWTDLLDIGGGTGALERIVTGGCYWLIDKSQESVASRHGPRRVHGVAEKLPFPDDSFDLVVSISTLQYLDQPAFFRECSRVLRPGGVLAIHENGGRNPVVRLGRVARRRAARRSPDQQSYLDTIRSYYVPLATPHPELTTTYLRSYFLLSPASTALDVKGYPRLARFTEWITTPVDKMLMRLPAAERMAWWNVQHFRMADRPQPAGR